MSASGGAAASEAANSLFGFALRPSQAQTVEAILEGRDALAVLPTGSGKSAIYQVAGVMLGGLTLVVSPLIALQRDQLRSITGRRYGGRAVEAALLNSGQRAGDRREALDRLARGELDFLFAGPEQLTNPQTRAAVGGGARGISLFVVDEAHLVSEWGQEFRPEYLRLVDAIAEFGGPPVLALTATASPPVQADITRRLAMRSPRVVVSGFDRPNISLAMRRTQPSRPESQAVDDACVDVIIQQDTPALVYAGVPASIDDYYQEIGRAGRDGQPAAAVLVHDPRTIRIPRSLAARTHLGEATLHRVVDALEDAGCRIAVADLARTADVAAHLVDRVVNELAELGFLGLSGSGRHRVVEPQRHPLSPADLTEQLVRHDKRRQAILSSRLDAARAYAESTRCRRAELLAYFGEAYSPPCGNCDNDRAPKRTEPAPRPTVVGGTPVRHRLWGEGQLLSRDDHELLVYFDRVGYKHLTASALASGVLERR